MSRDYTAPDTGPSNPQDIPPAGPHAKPELIDKSKTPGSGALPDDKTPEADVGPD